MRSPLAVRLTGAGLTAQITKRVSDLTVGATSPGGFASVTVSFFEPILSDYLDDFHTLTVYDGRTGETVGGGRLTDPGRSTGSGGETWQITAVGEGPAHMLDQTIPLVYIETSLDAFYHKTRFNAAAQAQVGGTPDAVSSENAIVISAGGGAVLNNGIVTAMYYDRLADCGMELGGFGYTRISGKTDANYQLESAVDARDGTPAIATISSLNFNVAAATNGPYVVVTNWTAGADILRFCTRRAGGAITVIDDTTWGAFYTLYVAAYRYLKTGAHTAAAGHANTYVLASEVVADMLGRGLLPRFDGTNAAITATTHQIDQLAWIDGVSPSQVMDELLALESGFTWHVWEKQVNDLYRFEFVAWPTVVRYDATVADGFDSPAPASDVYNAVKVRGRDKTGRVRWTTRTQTVDSLTALGITRTAMIDLADEVYSTANAQRAGDRFLADHATPPNAGTLTVARPIMDSVAGRWTQPWMIRPGNLIRVRGVRPSIDSLNATDRDGVTVFRVVSSVFNDSSQTATLELDAYSRTEARELARLARHRDRKS